MWENLLYIGNETWLSCVKIYILPCAWFIAASLQSFHSYKFPTNQKRLTQFLI